MHTMYRLFLKIGRKFWEYEHNVNRAGGAVKYVENNETGELAIYTRGEYREQLKTFIKELDYKVDMS